MMRSELQTKGSEENDIFIIFIFHQMNIYQKWNRMVQWISQHGGIIDGITINDQRDIIATKNIDTDHQIMNIPSQLHINGKNFESLSCRMSATMAELFLELQKGEQSFYYPYLSILPTNFNNHPFNIINNQNIHSYINLSQDFVYYIIQMKKKFKECFQQLQQLSYSDEQQLTYCFLLIQTRAWITEDQVSLIPAIDLLKHRNFKSSLGLMLDSRFIMSTKDTYQIGQEVFDNYGFKDNIMLLAQYNFLAENPILPVDLFSTPSLNEQLLKIRKYYQSFPCFTLDGPNQCLLDSFQLLNIDYHQTLLDSYNNLKDYTHLSYESDNLINSLRIALAQKRQIIENCLKN